MNQYGPFHVWKFLFRGLGELATSGRIANAHHQTIDLVAMFQEPRIVTEQHFLGVVLSQLRYIPCDVAKKFISCVIAINVPH